MPHTAITSAPFVESRPSFIIGDGTSLTPDPNNGIQLQCALASITHAVDQQFTEISTYCEEGAEAPGLAVHTFEVSFRQSYTSTDATPLIGIYSILEPLFKQRVWFAFAPVGDVVSVANPEISGQLYIPTIPIYEGSGPGQSLTSDVTFQIAGTPAVATTAVGAVSLHPGIV